MRRFLLGLTMFAVGALGIALIASMSLACAYTVNGTSNFWAILSLYHLVPLFLAYLLLTLAGLGISIWNTRERSN
ncbi:MAG: hypothetical protein IJ751_10750 [Oscillospiraceae bacterium]|nr:hypothetical protein [Oscillospiraceae bacterium]